MHGTSGARSRIRQMVRTLVPGFLVLLSFSISESPIAAQPGSSREDVDTVGLQVEAVVGWGGVVLPDGPVPVSFLLTNHSDRVIEGRLTLRNPQRGIEVRVEDVYLSPQATRRVSTVQSFTNWFECEAALSDDRQIFWRRELPVTSGSGFSMGGRWVLMIDRHGRKLLGVNRDEQPTASRAAYSANPLANVQELSIPSWQLPHHPGPLAMAAGMVFPENAPDDLNRLQWRAIAEWVCRGGNVFFHEQSIELIRQLTDALPLPPESASPAGELAIRRCGLGAICEYSRLLGNADGDPVRHQIIGQVGMLGHPNVWEVADSAWLEGTPGSRADLSRAIIIALFVGYALMSGMGSLLMFRSSRRQVGFYTLIIVLGSSVTAGMIGGYLRLNHGDLKWVTITQPGAGGAVQYARIDMQSAGGRNTTVAVAGGGHGGGTPDLQCSPLARGNSRWTRRSAGNTAHYPAFDWQPNLLSGKPDRGSPDVYQIQVPITPWGSRTCYATAFQPAIPELDFRLTLTAMPGHFDSPGRPPSGAFRVTLTNHLNQDLTAAWLIVTTTVPAGKSDGQTRSEELFVDRSGNVVLRSQRQLGEGRMAMYHVSALSPVAAGGTVNAEFAASFSTSDSWQRECRIEGASFVAPQHDFADATRIWLVAQVARSPILQIDKSHSDFVPREELHLIMQELRPEHLTDEANQLRFSSR